MCDHGLQAGSLDVLGEGEAVRVLVEEDPRGRQLVAETQVETGTRAHPLVGGTNLRLTLVAEREIRPDVRRREEDGGAMLRGAQTEGDPFLDRRRAVVPGRDHVRMTVDEAGAHASLDTS